MKIINLLEEFFKERGYKTKLLDLNLGWPTTSLLINDGMRVTGDVEQQNEMIVVLWKKAGGGGGVREPTWWSYIDECRVDSPTLLEDLLKKVKFCED